MNEMKYINLKGLSFFNFVVFFQFFKYVDNMQNYCSIMI